MNNEVDPTPQYFRDLARVRVQYTKEEELIACEYLGRLRESLIDLLNHNEEIVNYLNSYWADLVYTNKRTSKMGKEFDAGIKGMGPKIEKRINKYFLAMEETDSEEEVAQYMKLANLKYSLFRKAINEVGEDKLSEAATEYLSKVKKLEDELIRSALIIARSIARRYADKIFNMDINECTQIANMAVVESIFIFDPLKHVDQDKVYRFSTYVYSTIEAEIKTWILTNSRLVRLPKHKLDNISLILDAMHKNRVYSSSVTDITAVCNEVLEEKGSSRRVKKADISEAIRHINGSIPIYMGTMPRSDVNFSSDKPRTIGELLPDPSPNPEIIFEIKKNKQLVQKVIESSGLTTTEREVIELRYFSGNTHSFEFISGLVQNGELSREWVRYLHNSAMEKLKKSRYKKELLDILNSGVFEK